MIEDKPHGKPNPYTPRTYGPSLVFGMEGMPRHNQSTYAQPQNPFYNAPHIRYYIILTFFFAYPMGIIVPEKLEFQAIVYLILINIVEKL